VPVNLKGNEKKRRNRDPLGPRAHAMRYAMESQDKKTYLEKRAVESNYGKICSAIKRAKWAADSKKRIAVDMEEGDENCVSEFETPKAKLLPSMMAKRRTAVEYIFVQVMGSPDEDCWKRDGIVSSIMKRLAIPEGSRGSVVDILRDIKANNNVIL
jgi:hypothetical protein